MAPASPARVLPDIAADAEPGVAGQLDWVGMGDIEAPVTLLGDDGTPIRSAARITAFVDLNRPDVRGIHMSRLYLHVDKVLSQETLTPAALRRLLRDFLDSHAGLSGRAMVRIGFDYLLRRPALMSDNSGWKSYPVTISGLLENDHFQLELGCQVLYSSTCPCSAALARQLIQERFAQDFDGDQPIDPARMLAWLGSEEGICATPHSQRSAAEVKVRLKPAFNAFPIVALIDAIEGALKTPVQTAVKREDEQAFARLNGANLMFCEDAARRMQAVLDQDERVADFWIRASHFESLHPHNAVAVASKGVAGGYRGGIDG
jgi:GTP cyclohydrolase I